MAIPSSSLRILRDVQWNNEYNHVRRFESLQEQQNYMASKIAFNLGNAFSYIRNDAEHPIRVNLTEAQVISCNYIMYQNPSYGTKWFYAFITRVEYVADGVTNIYFEPDLFQTWYFQFDVAPCFVEREHVNNDTVGANTVPEGLECGPYVVNSARTENFGGMGIAMLTTQNINGDHTFDVYNNVFSGLVVYRFKTTNVAEETIQEFIDQGLENAIICLYMFPLLADDGTIDDPGTSTLELEKPYHDIDGYVPKNNKLFCYPYNYIVLNNNAGSANEIRYELFDGDKATFESIAVAVTMPEGYVGPTNYRGLTRDFDNGLTVKNFPQCGFSGDTFKAWWAQNKTSMLVSGIGGAVSSGIGSGLSSLTTLAAGGMAVGTAIAPGVGTVAGAAIGAGIGVAQSLLQSATGALAEYTHMSALPDSSHGQAQTESLQAGIGRVGVTFYAVNIRREFAERIDDYFSQFGYKVGKIKYPNTHGRRSWNFVKTIGAEVQGPAPVEARTLFENMLNRGVTFWHVNDVGNYSLDNSIV